MTYRAVGFDYDGVVKGGRWKDHQGQMAAYLGASLEDYEEAFGRQRALANPNLSQCTWQEFWQRVATDLGHPERGASAFALNERRIAESTLNDDVLELVQEVRAAGYRTGLLTNHVASIATVIREEGIEPLFEVIHISQVTGLAKPDPAAFRHLAEALGVSVAELIFIDDNQSSLRRADEAGFAPILFESATQTRAALVALGVLA